MLFGNEYVFFLRDAFVDFEKNMTVIHWFWKWTYWVCVDGVNSCILKTWWSHIDFENEHAVFVVMILIVFWKCVNFPAFSKTKYVEICTWFNIKIDLKKCSHNSRFTIYFQKLNFKKKQVLFWNEHVLVFERLKQNIHIYFTHVYAVLSLLSLLSLLSHPG